MYMTQETSCLGFPGKAATSLFVFSLTFVLASQGSSRNVKEEAQKRPGGKLLFDRGHGRLGIPPGDPSAHEPGDER